MSAVINFAAISWIAFPGDEQGWIATCEPLGLMLDGSSLDELHSLIPETMNLLFADLIEDGDLEKFLIERGWNESDGTVVREAHRQESVVPWQLVAEGAKHGSQRRAH